MVHTKITKTENKYIFTLLSPSIVITVPITSSISLAEMVPCWKALSLSTHNILSLPTWHVLVIQFKSPGQLFLYWSPLRKLCQLQEFLNIAWDVWCTDGRWQVYMEVEVSIVILVKTPEQLLHKPLRVLQRHHAAVQAHHLLPAHLAVRALSLENTEAKSLMPCFTRAGFDSCCLSLLILIFENEYECSRVDDWEQKWNYEGQSLNI